jgi:Bacteriophage Mu Gam like protein
MTDRSLIEADLNEFVEGEAWPTPDPSGAPVPPDSNEKAASILRKLHRLGDERAEIEAIAQAQIDRIVAWREDRLKGITRDEAWGRGALESYWRMAATPMSRSVSLPDGRLKLTKTRWHVVVTDTDAFMAWAVDYGHADGEDDAIYDVVTVKKPDFVRVNVAPDLAAIGKRRQGPDDALSAFCATPDGELIPGVECQRDTVDTFGIDL